MFGLIHMIRIINNIQLSSLFMPQIIFVLRIFSFLFFSFFFQFHLPPFAHNKKDRRGRKYFARLFVFLKHARLKRFTLSIIMFINLYELFEVKRLAFVTEINIHLVMDLAIQYVEVCAHVLA